MHGYMRMYWGKKILEWTERPQDAFRVALRLNNRYQLDGHDPNSFAGVAWCFGKHDRPWAERPVFGMVRYMNAKGLERKFDIDGYVRRVALIAGPET
jgi:deoxyribodipyrimidine photo-lyase